MRGVWSCHVDAWIPVLCVTQPMVTLERISATVFGSRVGYPSAFFFLLFRSLC